VSDLELEDDLIPCRDPECAGQAEEEVDGDVRYRVCQACGFEFAYERIEVGGEQGVCQIGVPEDLRRAASGPMEEAMAAEGRSKMIPLIVKKPDA
jgi:hypothetical protein